MVTGHFLVQLADGSVEVSISVLLVHVVDTSSGLIFQDDSEGFNMVRSFFKDFVYGEYLTLSALGLQ